MTDGVDTMLTLSDGTVHLDFRRASPAEIASAIAKLAPHERRALLHRVGEVLAAGASAAEDDSAGLAKVLVALLPETQRDIVTLIRRKGPPELLFSLFCFLDQTLEMELPRSCIVETEEAIGTYLLEVPSEVARAPWMAGDLLGDHWPLEAGLPLLLHAARNGRFVAGRSSAIHGLSHALDRADKSVQWKIVEALNQVIATDKSQVVRTYAEGVLGDLRGY